MTRRNAERMTNLAVALLAIALAAPAAAQLDPGRIGWSEITLHADKLGFSIDSTIGLESAPAAAELIAAGDRRALAPRHAESGLMTIDSKGVGQHSQVRFWFEKKDAQALQRSELSISKKRQKHRTYRYTPGGVFARSKKPASGEDDLPHEKWTDVSEGFTEYPDGLEKGVAITEPSALFYLLPALELAPGQKSQFFLYAKGSVNPIEVEVKGREKIKIEYVEKSAAGERRVGGPVQAIRVAVRPRVAKGESKSNFKLLGLEGDVDLFFDAKTRVLLQLAGKVKVAGAVKIRLKEAVVE